MRVQKQDIRLGRQAATLWVRATLPVGNQYLFKAGGPVPLNSRASTARTALLFKPGQDFCYEHRREVSYEHGSQTLLYACFPLSQCEQPRPGTPTYLYFHQQRSRDRCIGQQRRDVSPIPTELAPSSHLDPSCRQQQPPDRQGLTKTAVTI